MFVFFKKKFLFFVLKYVIVLQIEGNSATSIQVIAKQRCADNYF